MDLRAELGNYILSIRAGWFSQSLFQEFYTHTCEAKTEKGPSMPLGHASGTNVVSSPDARHVCRLFWRR